jgi:hypothetical protein
LPFTTHSQLAGAPEEEAQAKVHCLHVHLPPVLLLQVHSLHLHLCFAELLAEEVQAKIAF